MFAWSPLSRILLASVLLLTTQADVQAATAPLQLAVGWSDRAPELVRFDVPGEEGKRSALSSDLHAPLGSLWKLFVYYQLIEKKSEPAPYRCTGAAPEEIFCCAPGGQVRMDEALAKSCGLFFRPERLSLSSEDWRTFWNTTIGANIPWLNDLSKVRAETEVPVAELLQVLEKLKTRAATYQKVRTALAKVVTEGTAAGSFRKIGTLYRVKTWTWDPPEGVKTRYQGGFAGWTASGVPVWARSLQTGARTLSDWGKTLETFATKSVPASDSGCVVVRMFDRYPLQEVKRLPSGEVVSGGALAGRFQLTFRNSNRIELRSKGELTLKSSPKGQWIEGYFGLQEYLARVIDREISAEPVEAARAFSIVMRTFLEQNGFRRDGCLHAVDSTRFQRVSSSPASAKAKRVVAWTEGLVIEGIPNVRYHAHLEGPNRISWNGARSLALSGYGFDQILRSTYASGQVVMGTNRRLAGCERLPQAERWLAGAEKKWRRHLHELPGFQEPGPFEVCILKSRTPYSDSSRNRIYLRFEGDLESQVTAAHEYLHLAFKHHPAGMNEEFIEKTARRIVLEKE